MPVLSYEVLAVALLFDPLPLNKLQQRRGAEHEKKEAQN